MSDETTAPGVQQILGAAGACPEIVHGKRRWKVGHPTQAAKARLEKLAAKVALDEVRRLKDTLDPAAYQEAFGEAVKSLKNYRTWRPGWQAVVFDPANSHLYLWSLIQEHHPDASEEDVLAICRDAPEEVVAAMAQVLPDFFRLLLSEIRPHLSPEAFAAAEATVGQMRARLEPTPASTAT